MRKIYNIIIGFFSAIILLLSVVFMVVEGRLLFSGDWLVYDNVTLGFFKYFFRFLLSIGSATYAIFEFINMKKNSKKIEWFLLVGNTSLIIMSLVLLFTSTNMVGEIALIISVAVLIVKLVTQLIFKTKLEH